MTLLELINNNHNIIIYGEVGSGKNLLLRKLLNSPNLLESKKRFVRKSQTLANKYRVQGHLEKWIFITTDEHKKKWQ